MSEYFNDVWDKAMVEVLEKAWGLSPYHEPLMSMAGGLIEGSSVLDVGCGLGYLIPHVPQDIEYLGLDQSKAMLDRASELHPGARFIQTDLYTFSPERSFDTVVCLDVLIHQRSLLPALPVLFGYANKFCIITLLQTSSKNTGYREGPRGECMLYLSRHEIEETLAGKIYSEMEITDEKRLFKIKV